MPQAVMRGAVGARQIHFAQRSGWRRNKHSPDVESARPLRLGLQTHPWRCVLIALVQGVIGASHEHFAPFQEGGREKSRDRADDDFLEKGGVHGPLLESRSGASELPVMAFNVATALWPVRNFQINPDGPQARGYSLTKIPIAGSA